MAEVETLPVAIASADLADLAELRDWAANSDRSLDDLLADAIQEYLERGRRWIAETDVGLEDIRQGRVVSHEQILRDIDERRRQFGIKAAE